MTRNAIQMQKGLSLTELNEQFGTEEKCKAAVFKWRWPDGLYVPRAAAATTPSSVRASSTFATTARRRLRSNPARSSRTSQLPLTKWFHAMYLLAQSKNSISAPGACRASSASAPTPPALLRHKLMSVMAEREGGAQARRPCRDG